MGPRLNTFSEKFILIIQKPTIPLKWKFSAPGSCQSGPKESRFVSSLLLRVTPIGDELPLTIFFYLLLCVFLFFDRYFGVYITLEKWTCIFFPVRTVSTSFFPSFYGPPQAIISNSGEFFRLRELALLSSPGSFSWPVLFSFMVCLGGGSDHPLLFTSTLPAILPSSPSRFTPCPGFQSSFPLTRCLTTARGRLSLP